MTSTNQSEALTALTLPSSFSLFLVAVRQADKNDQWLFQQGNSLILVSTLTEASVYMKEDEALKSAQFILTQIPAAECAVIELASLFVNSYALGLDQNLSQSINIEMDKNKIINTTPLPPNFNQILKKSHKI